MCVVLNMWFYTEYNPISECLKFSLSIINRVVVVLRHVSTPCSLLGVCNCTLSSQFIDKTHCIESENSLYRYENITAHILWMLI